MRSIADDDVKAIALSLDYDGAISPGFNSSDSRAAKKVILFMHSLLNRHKNAELVLYNGSYRNTNAINLFNWHRNNNGSCLEMLEYIKKQFMMNYPEYKDRITLNKIMVEDIQKQRMLGDSFEKGLKMRVSQPFKVSGVSPEWFDEMKTALLYLQQQNFLMGFPGVPTLFYFLDDRVDILQTLYTVYSDPSYLWAPRSHYLRLMRCVRGNISLFAEINGDGFVDEHYKETVLGFPQRPVVHRMRLTRNHRLELLHYFSDTEVLFNLIEYHSWEKIIEAIRFNRFEKNRTKFFLWMLYQGAKEKNKEKIDCVLSEKFEIENERCDDIQRLIFYAKEHGYLDTIEKIVDKLFVLTHSVFVEILELSVTKGESGLSSKLAEKIKIDFSNFDVCKKAFFSIAQRGRCDLLETILSYQKNYGNLFLLPRLVGCKEISTYFSDALIKETILLTIRGNERLDIFLALYAEFEKRKFVFSNENFFNLLDYLIRNNVIYFIKNVLNCFHNFSGDEKNFLNELLSLEGFLNSDAEIFLKRLRPFLRKYIDGSIETPLVHAVKRILDTSVLQNRPEDSLFLIFITLREEQSSQKDVKTCIKKIFLTLIKETCSIKNVLMNQDISSAIYQWYLRYYDYALLLKKPIKSIDRDAISFIMRLLAVDSFKIRESLCDGLADFTLSDNSSCQQLLRAYFGQKEILKCLGIHSAYYTLRFLFERISPTNEEMMSDVFALFESSENNSVWFQTNESVVKDAEESARSQCYFSFFWPRSYSELKSKAFATLQKPEQSDLYFYF